LLGGEVLGGDLLGGAAVGGVVGLDGLDGGEDVVHGLPREQAAAGGQHLAEPRLLGDDRAARGQVAGGAIAEPAGARAAVLVPGHGELAARLMDVVPVAADVARDLPRLPLAPAVSDQALAHPAAAVDRQLERGPRSAGQVEDLLELAVLGPVVGVAAVDDVLALVVPGGDGGVAVPRCAAVAPQLQRHWLAGGAPGDAPG